MINFQDPIEAELQGVVRKDMVKGGCIGVSLLPPRSQGAASVRPSAQAGCGGQQAREG